MIKKQKIIRRLILVLVVGISAGVGLSKGGKVKGSNKAKGSNYKPVEIYFYLSEKPLLNKEINLVTTVIPKKDIGIGSVKLTLPEGITLVGTESLTWNGNIKKMNLSKYQLRLR